MNVDDLRILPGLINAHDHLEFALFPLLGRGPYNSAAEWARDVYRPDESPVADHLNVPKHIRLMWGGIRNLLAGVTTVCHHNPYHPVFDEDSFPVRVLKRYGWAHSFAFEPDIRGCFHATPEGAPFILHIAEGNDAASREELQRLASCGALNSYTVAVHAVAADWDLLRAAGASVVACPRSNVFTLGRSIPRDALLSDVPAALGTDSPITADGDLLDEIAFARDQFAISDETLLDMVTETAAKILRYSPPREDWIAVREFGAPPDLVVINGRIQLVSRDLAPNGLPGLHRLSVKGRPPVYVRAPIPDLLRTTREALGTSDIRLGGRRILQ